MKNLMLVMREEEEDDGEADGNRLDENSKDRICDLPEKKINNMVNILVDEQMQMSKETDPDVDAMSYEEILALEEQIGYVSSGLTGEHIVHHLRPVAYHFLRLGPPVEEDPCCVCQKEYVNGEELARLPCSHQFHYNCINQWLMQKNVCPICKAAVCSEGN